AHDADREHHRVAQRRARELDGARPAHHRRVDEPHERLSGLGEGQGEREADEDAQLVGRARGDRGSRGHGGRASPEQTAAPLSTCCRRARPSRLGADVSASAIDFWFDLASPYSALAALRIGDVARGLEVRWHPFLLGPIFQAQGWNDSPFNLYPAKGRWMWRDVPRRAPRLGATLRQPGPVPPHSLPSPPVAPVALGGGWGGERARATAPA